MPPHISHYTEYPPPGGFSPFVNGIATSSIQVTRFHKWAGSGGHGFLLEAQSINQQQSDHRQTNGEPTIPLFGTLIIISPFSPEIIREWCKRNFQKKYQLWQISSVRIHSPVSRNVEKCICTRQDEATSTLPPPPTVKLETLPPRHSAVYLPVTKSPFRENLQFVNDVWSRSHPLKPPLNRNYL